MSFRSIVGHRRLVSLLSRAVARDTLPPSLLLAGPAGIGKRRTALALAAAVNCLNPRRLASGGPEGPPLRTRTATPQTRTETARTGTATSRTRTEPPRTGTATPVGADLQVRPHADGVPGGEPTADVQVRLELDACDECASCRRIQRAVHPDVILIEPGDSGSIKIEQVRDVIDRAGYRPFEGRRRVVIIDEADALVPAAQNALLKTLEEPPSASVFVLVSSMADALLPTVRSRCPRLRFGPLAASEVADALIRDHGYAEAEARAAAVEAGGSIGLALAAESADLAEARDTAQRILENAARVNDPSRRLDSVKDATGKKGTSATEREQLAACLRAMASLLRDVSILATHADTGALANADLQPQLARLAVPFDCERSMRAYGAVDQALAALERNASPKVVADWLVLQL